MITLMNKHAIILAVIRDQKSQRQVAREMGISRKTISKYLREYEAKKNQILLANKQGKATEALIEDLVHAPKYNSTNRRNRVMTDQILERINFFLEENDIIYTLDPFSVKMIFYK